jgi:hypothetical protein
MSGNLRGVECKSDVVASGPTELNRQLPVARWIAIGSAALVALGSLQAWVVWHRLSRVGKPLRP